MPNNNTIDFATDEEIRYECLCMITASQSEDTIIPRSADDMIEEAEKLFKYIKEGV